MSTKKPAALLAFVGACALAVTAPATLASPVLPGSSGVSDGAAALPTGDIDTALTSKSGQSAPSSTDTEADPARVVGVIVQLEDSASREGTINEINEAVAMRPGQGLVAAATASDRHVVDGAVRGLARGTAGLGWLASLTESGYVRSYASYMLVGVVLALVAVLATRF